MRKLAPLLALCAFAGLDAGIAIAQEAHPTVALTGCLAQDDGDDDAVFMLRQIQGDAVSADEVVLNAAEDVNLAPHVGHTVEATGMVIGDEMRDMADEADDMAEGGDDVKDEGDDDMEDEGDDRDDDMYVHVTELAHIAASCEDG